MIQSKEDLKFYLKADAIAIGAGQSKPHFISIYETDVILKYQINLRKAEYYYNVKRKKTFEVDFVIFVQSLSHV